MTANMAASSILQDSMVVLVVKNDGWIKKSKKIGNIVSGQTKLKS